MAFKSLFRVFCFLICFIAVVGCNPEQEKKPIVVPVVILSSDYANYKNNTTLTKDVNQAENNFSAIVNYVRDWYRYKVGKTYEVSRPQRIQSKLSSQEWLNLSEVSKTEFKRFDFHLAVYNEVKPIMTDAKKKFVVTV